MNVNETDLPEQEVVVSDRELTESDSDVSSSDGEEKESKITEKNELEKDIIVEEEMKDLVVLKQQDTLQESVSEKKNNSDQPCRSIEWEKAEKQEVGGEESPVIQKKTAEEIGILKELDESEAVNEVDQVVERDALPEIEHVKAPLVLKEGHSSMNDNASTIKVTFEGSPVPHSTEDAIEPTELSVSQTDESSSTFLLTSVQDNDLTAKMHDLYLKEFAISLDGERTSRQEIHTEEAVINAETPSSMENSTFNQIGSTVIVEEPKTSMLETKTTPQNCIESLISNSLPLEHEKSISCLSRPEKSPIVSPTISRRNSTIGFPTTLTTSPSSTTTVIATSRRQSRDLKTGAQKHLALPQCLRMEMQVIDYSAIYPSLHSILTSHADTVQKQPTTLCKDDSGFRLQVHSTHII